MLLSILFLSLSAWAPWADDKPPLEVKSVRVVITHTLPEIPPEKNPSEIQNPNQGPSDVAKSEDFFPNAHWGVFMTHVPHQAAQIVLHGSDDQYLGTCDVTVIFQSAGFEPFGTFDESNSSLELSKWDGKKLRHLLGDYKGYEFGLSIGAGTKYRTVTHATQGIEFSDFAGEWGALGFNLGRAFITLAPRGSCVGNIPLDWQTTLKSAP